MNPICIFVHSYINLILNQISISFTLGIVNGKHYNITIAFAKILKNWPNLASNGGKPTKSIYCGCLGEQN